MDKNAFVYKRMPANIHGRSLYISHGQSRYEKGGFVGLMVIAFCLFVFTPIVSAGPIEESVQMSGEWVKAFNGGER